MINKIKIFGEYRKVVISPTPKNESSKIYYKFSEDNNTITLFPWEYTNVDSLMKHVSKSLFINVLIPYIRKIKQEFVPKAAFNQIEFKKSQKCPLKLIMFQKKRI